MDEIQLSIETQDVAVQWFQIAKGVAQGQLTPEEGIAGLHALAEAYPTDRDWLQEEIETIWRQFGLDVAEHVRAGYGSYWEKIRQVVTALLDERLDHARALELLALIDAQHPEHTAQTAHLVKGIRESPLRHYLEKDT